MQKLDTVLDPCSVAAGRPVSIVAMGLVTSLQIEGGTARVGLRTTFPGCTMAPTFAAAAEEQLLCLPEVERVEVEIDPRFTWTPDQATPEARAARDHRSGPRPVLIPWALRTQDPARRP